MLSDLQSIRIEDFDYPLPDGRIARYPLEQRDHSKLLALRGNRIEEHHFYDLPSLLPGGATLVFNNTRVIHARLHFRKPTGAAIEVFCLEPFGQPVATAFEQRSRCSWVCLVGNNRKWKDGALSGKWRTDNGERKTEGDEMGTGTDEFELRAVRRQAVGEAWVVDFEWTGGLSFAEVIDCAGVIPLPPYLGREAEADDATRYQTVYARHDGSVAAPTAGLHFTPQVMEALRQRGFGLEYLTLHVGAGTFKPVGSDTIGGHEMHVEQVVVSRSTIARLAAPANGPLVAVGTTSVRTLESLYWFGVKLLADPSLSAMSIGQWDPYTLPHADASPAEALGAVLQWMDERSLGTLCGETRLMIAPGYAYRLVSGLVTNFHQPRSTLLLLVSALVGDRWRECYRYALDHGFRFLSYGDSCLFLP